MFYIRAELDRAVAGPEIEAAELLPGLVAIERQAGLDEPRSNDLGPLKIVQGVGGLAAIDAVERRFVDVDAELVGAGKVEQLEPACRGILIDQTEIAVETLRHLRELLALPVDAEKQAGEAAVAGEAQAHLARHHRHVGPERGRGQAEAGGVVRLQRQVLALHRQHRRERIAVTRRETARRKVRPAHQKRRDRPEDPAGRRLVLVGMHDGGLIEQDHGFGHVAAAHEQAGAFIDHRHAGEGLDRQENVGGSAGRGDDLQRVERGGLGLARGIGLRRDDGFFEPQQRLLEDELHHDRVAGRQVDGARSRLVPHHRGAHLPSALPLGGELKLPAPVRRRPVGGTLQKHVDKRHPVPGSIDDPAAHDGAIRRLRPGGSHQSEQEKEAEDGAKRHHTGSVEGEQIRPRSAFSACRVRFSPHPDARLSTKRGSDR